jgi:hypothetical protein
MRGIRDCVDRNWLLLPFWLNGSGAGKPDSTPFSIDYEKATVERYVSQWQRLICYCIRIVREEEKYGAEFMSCQRELLVEARELIESGQAYEERMDSIMFDLSVRFITYSDYRTQKSAVIHFCGVLGNDEKANRFRPPNNC